jgi:hypothetical protein
VYGEGRVRGVFLLICAFSFDLLGTFRQLNKDLYDKYWHKVGNP